MESLLQIDIARRIAELYLSGGPEDDRLVCWRVEYKSGGDKVIVIGDDYNRVFNGVANLCEDRAIPDIVKWAAKGLPGIPREWAK